MEYETAKDTLAPVAMSVRQVRRAVGWLGFLCPIVLLVGYVVLEGGPLPGSISDYYYTHTMGPAFLAFILALGVSLILYQYKGADSWISTFAGLFVTCVALFPTLPSNPIGPWQSNVNLVHHTCAGLFIACLAFMTLFLFTRSSNTKTKLAAPLGQTRANLAALARRIGWRSVARALQPDEMRYPTQSLTDRKRVRNQIYDICGLLIVIDLAFLIAVDVFHISVRIPRIPEVYFFETLAVWAFAFAWLVKGETFRFLNDRAKN